MLYAHQMKAKQKITNKKIELCEYKFSGKQ